MAFRPTGSPNAKRGRTPPPEDTFEEAAFLKALGEKQKTVRVKLMDGQTVSGWIEYYDKYMVRLTREVATLQAQAKAVVHRTPQARMSANGVQ